MTEEQAIEYLASIGVTLPEFLLRALMGRIDTIEPCLVGSGYDENTRLLIKLYLLALIGVTQGDRYVTSQRAPSGAAQSFRFGTTGERYRQQLSMLRLLDTKGCADGLIPADPDAAEAAIFVGMGGRYQ